MTTTSIEFDEATHTYTVDGEVKASVTQILQDVGIVQPGKYAPGAANFGTAIHKATQALDSGVVTLEDYRDTDYYDKLSAYQRFLDREKPEYRKREEVLYSLDYDFCGTVDIECILHGQPAVIDIKTGARNKEPWHGIQLALYDVLLGSPPLGDGRLRYNLYLGKGVYTLKKRPRPSDYTAGLGAVAIWHWRNDT